MRFTSINLTSGKSERLQHVPYILDERTMTATDARTGRIIARFHHSDVKTAKAHLDSITEQVMESRA